MANYCFVFYLPFLVKVTDRPGTDQLQASLDNSCNLYPFQYGFKSVCGPKMVLEASPGGTGKGGASPGMCTIPPLPLQCPSNPSNLPTFGRDQVVASCLLASHSQSPLKTWARWAEVVAVPPFWQAEQITHPMPCPSPPPTEISGYRAACGFR